MWVCKKCAGEILMVTDNVLSVVQRVKKNKSNFKTIIDKSSLEEYGFHYQCSKCKMATEYSESYNIEKIATWVMQKKTQ